MIKRTWMSSKGQMIMSKEEKQLEGRGVREVKEEVEQEVECE